MPLALFLTAAVVAALFLFLPNKIAFMYPLYTL